MTCQDVQAMLEALTLPRLQAQNYSVLNLHVQRCAACQQMWQQWLYQERQLAGFLAIESAPAGLWETIMAQTATHKRDGNDDPLWRKIVVEASPQGLHRLTLSDLADEALAPDSTARAAALSPLLDRAREQLREYFRGERAIFQLPVNLRHCSAFERAVLDATATIPYGEVRSYKWLAERIGRPKATRAVGNALHKNPLPIVIPCHRVVKSDGSLGGYAFGDTWKIHLLTLEGATVPYIGCSSTRILCYRGCHHERRVRDHNRIHFADLHEALTSGYRPCTVCQPAKGND